MSTIQKLGLLDDKIRTYMKSQNYQAGSLADFMLENIRQKIELAYQSYHGERGVFFQHFSFVFGACFVLDLLSREEYKELCEIDLA